MSRVLICGGTGAIGSGLADALDPARWEPLALGREDGDLLEPGVAERLIAEHRPDALVHLAWSIRGHGFFADPGNLRWLEASERLLTAFSAAGGGRALVAGTCAEYEAGAIEGPVPETAPLIPLDGPREERERYAWAKRRLHAAAEGIPDLELAWARIFFVFSRHDEPGRLIGDLLAARRGGPRAEVRAGGLVRDYLPAREAGTALAALLDSDLTGAVNVGSGRGETISSLAAEAAASIGLDPGEVHDEGIVPADAAPAIVADISRLLKATGWTPPGSVRESVSAELGASGR